MQLPLKNKFNFLRSLIERKELLALLIIIVILFVTVEPAYAGPGGFVAKGLFKTWWGKLLLVVIGIILLPFIIYVRFREYIAVRKNKKLLTKLATINDDFRWSQLEKNVKNVYTRVYAAWSKENMEEVSNYVSSWYWQNQQLVVLDQWKENQLKNICHLEGVGAIKPLHLEITNRENLEGSRIAFSITGRIEDYLIHRDTETIVHGRRGYQDEEKVWFMEYTDGKWLLDDIQAGTFSLAFAKLKNIVPETLPQPTISRQIPKA